MPGKKGFLLLEVMVSVVIITASLLFIGRIYSSSKAAMARSQEFFKAALLVEEAAFGCEEPGIIERGTREGAFTGDNQYNWSVNAVALPTEELALDITTIEAFGRDPGKFGRYSVTTYLRDKARI